MPTRMVLGYLASRGQVANIVVRRGLLKIGGTMQRLGARFIGDLWRRSSLLAPLYAPAPPIAPRGLAAHFPPGNDPNHALLILPAGEPVGTVFYFPGCGSERLHADIALAAIFLLIRTGVRVVMPPKYLCCGFPARANAKIDLSSRQELRNTIIFNQIRSMLGYLDFDGCLISCGTCSEALKRIGVTDIFGAPVCDVSEFVLSRGFEARLAGQCFYHPPCHDSLSGKGVPLLESVASEAVTLVPHCCSEAGTLALSRPDIAAAMLDRKRSALVPPLSNAPKPLLLTNCPACLNGLGRQQLTAPQHLAVVLADACGPGAWRLTAARQLAQAELIRI